MRREAGQLSLGAIWRCPLAPVRTLTAQNWMATPASWSIWLAGGGVTES
jgi:hypothetical protein